MKLSFKFFCIAYIVVLIAAGVPSAVFIENSARNEWQAREEKVEAGTGYAVSSFLSLAELSSANLTDGRLKNISAQISRSLDGVDSFSIERYEGKVVSDKKYERQEEYLSQDGKIQFCSTAKVLFEGETFKLSCKTDFTDLKESQSRMRGYYVITVLSVALIGGLLLFVAARGVTRPLKKLTLAANEIKDGNYGKTVEAGSRDSEIAELAESFNAMSEATEQALREIKAEVERRERFIADFTHEMKTPMTSIIGYAQLLDRYELSEQEKKTAAAAIGREGKRLEALSRQLLELIVAGNDKVEFSAHALFEIERRLFETMAFSAKKYGGRLRFLLPRTTVRVNLPLVLSLFYNLIDNALKSLDEGGEVTVSGKVSGGRVIITVADNGRGISEEGLKHLTEPFYREDKARSRRQGGSGIGLALSKQIAELHGGTLSFKSKLGEGTEVSFSLEVQEK